MEDDVNDRRILQTRSKQCSTTMRAACKGSHSIVKQAAAARCQPSTLGIRIIHIFAPEIIKTDPSNFRELVQKLTGNPIGRSPRMRRRVGTGRKHWMSARSESAEPTRAVSPVAKEEEDASSRKSTADPTFFFDGVGDPHGMLAGTSETASSGHTSRSSPLLLLEYSSNRYAF